MKLFSDAGSAMTGGYSRRSLPADPKAVDRRRLLADRNAYIAYLESQLQRYSETTLDVESTAKGLRSLKQHVEDLEDRLRNLHTSVDLVQVQSSQSSEISVLARKETEQHLDDLQKRTSRIEQLINEHRLATESEIVRLRNELALGVQELYQQLDSRTKALKGQLQNQVRTLQVITDDGTSTIIREAQATCVRLADDALGAAEASQRKVEELSKQAESAQRRLEDLVSQTEAGLEALRADVVGVRAEFAGSGVTVGSQSSRFVTPRGPDIVTYSTGSNAAASVALKPTQPENSTVYALADAIERRLSSRLGQQVLQLSEVLRRVVQCQVSMTGQMSGTVSSSHRVFPTPRDPTSASPLEFSTTVASNIDRKAAVDELYRELRMLDTNRSRNTGRYD